MSTLDECMAQAEGRAACVTFATPGGIAAADRRITEEPRVPRDMDPQKAFMNNANRPLGETLTLTTRSGASVALPLIGMAIEKGFITSTDQLASDFITEWQADDRINITIEHLLDMRSGLVPVCFLPSTGDLGECANQGDAAAGGNIVFSVFLEIFAITTTNVPTPMRRIAIQHTQHVRSRRLQADLSRFSQKISVASFGPMAEPRGLATG